MQAFVFSHQQMMPRKFRVNVGKVTELKGWHSLQFLNRKGPGLALWKGAREQIWKLFAKQAQNFF